MEIITTHKGVQYQQTIPTYILSKLDNNPEDVANALARLIDILAEKGVLDARNITDITGDYFMFPPARLNKY